ncbi:hypothetical protein HNO91_22480 [Pseudomonas corrugata]|uniref:Uncharacterized protein n=1 Tax=Pseudomonas corrugata TaxID=47879 RepID=A0A7Y5Z8W4_9PSED|nr:hypothetical protein [Pseudomonas corrugata]NUT89207.1 hypothetical protein [Pseudomonas corrugata]
MVGRGKKICFAAVASVLVACALMVFFALDGVTENPKNLSDTQGIPAATMYTVILIIMTAASVALMGLGNLFQRLLRQQPFKWRVGWYAFTNVLLFLTSLLGTFVAAIYMYDSIAGVSGALLFALSVVLILIGVPRKSE